MRGWAQRIGAGIAALALVVPGRAADACAKLGRRIEFARFGHTAGRLCAEGECRTGADQRCGARRQDRRAGRGLKQSDFSIYENGKQQQIATFDFQSVDMADAAQRGHGQRPGRRDQRQREQGRRRREARRPAQSSPDRDVLRPDLDAARRSGSQRGGGAGFSQEQNAARRPGGAGLARRHAQGRPGLHRRQGRADRTKSASTTAPKGRALRRAPPPTPTRWKTPPATRPTRASTTTSTPTASFLRCAPISQVARENHREEVAALLLRRHLARRH